MWKYLGITLGVTTLLTGFASGVLGIQLSDGTNAFEKAPRLLDAITTYSSVRVPAAKYYFTIAVPENAGEPLGKIVIGQRYSPETIRFSPEKTVAFEGTYTNRGKSFTINEAQWDRQFETVTVTFDPPIEPGNTITLGLKPIQNPDYGGVYLFGVTVFPVGENSAGLYLGVGRLHFYQNGDRQ
ncbi:conserved hypothetical protein [Gloeothece citriformis PCC 7424]|uniref:DUF2808 domain-containing protein n=1 Tax=Gloeothece citriformis (strain PCC 7424) TaxID=65393 RepID=B7KIQ4_GLOC7|nr:DUF2808 domain-containing protein [Gloeothece citriformis]ACK69460.1 conserved hypothetical protein [Gloeothece citriformis PCC 7424]